MDTDQKNSKKGIRIMFSKERIIIIFLFLISFFYALFLLQGLSFYMYGYDDFHIIYQTLHLSFADILSRILFYPLEFYSGFLALGAYQRVVHGLFLKLSYIIGGLDPYPYHILRGLFFAFTGVLVYLFTKKITKNTLVSIAAGFLYYSFPVIYDGLRHIGAAEPFSDFFLLLAFYLFITFYDDERSYTSNKKYSRTLLLFLITLVAIKARETSLVLLPAFATFLLLKWKDYRRNKMWLLIVFFLSLYLVPALLTSIGVVDTEHSMLKITSEKIITNIKDLLLYNPVTRTGSGEQTLVIFSLQQYLSEVPGSLVGSFGFFIVWYFVAMLVAYIFYHVKNKRNAGTSHSVPSAVLPSNTYFTLALLWFIFSVLLIIFYVNIGDHSDIRYIGIMALPAVLVIIPFCYFMTAYIKKSDIKYLSKYILIIFFLILFLSIIVNTSVTSIYRRGGVGSRHKGMEQATLTIFEDFYNQSFDMSYFFAMTEISGEDKYIPCIFSTNISLSEIVVTNDPFLSFTRLLTDANINISLSKYGLVYVISYRLSASEIPLLENYPNIHLIKEINACEDGYYCQVKEFLKRQSIAQAFIKKQLNEVPRYFVYKIVENERTIAFEKPVTMICSGEEGLPKNML